MTPERWERVAAVFGAVQETPACERVTRLHQLCGDDGELAREVAALLASAEAADGFLSTSASVFSQSAAEGGESAAPAWGPGTELAGRYRIERWLGSGGMGEVYAAHDGELGGEVAIKRLRGTGAADPGAQLRLKREVMLARQVSHANVCRIHDWGAAGLSADGDSTFFTMELLSGETLRARLRRQGRCPERQARLWLEQIAAGLDAAHAAGVVHGDLKPGNVMLTGETGAERAVITDFGLAGTAAGEEAGRRAAGTLAYMAPEQWSGGPASTASDLYAYGLIAYELLTGSPASLLPRLAGGAPAPSAAAPGLGRGWDEMAAACLATDPARRPAAATAALELAGRTGAAPGWRHPLWPVAATVSLLVVALAAAGLRWRAVRPQVPPGTAILLTPLVNATGQSQFDGADAALQQQLQQSGHFALLAPSQVRQALARMGQAAAPAPAELAQRPVVAREVAMRAGAPLVIFGTLTSAAGGYRLELEMDRTGHDPDEPARRWTDVETASSSRGLFDALHAAANWVRSQAGEPEAELASTDQPPQDITTSSWTALSLYARAESERAAGHTPSSLALLRAATNADPGFALAWVRLGDEQNPEDLSGASFADYRRALALAASSRRLSQRERLRVEGDFAMASGDERRSAQSFAAYSALYPHDYLGWFYQAYPAVALGEAAQAEAALARAQELAPTSVPVAANRGFVALWRGDTALARQQTEHLSRLPGAQGETAMLQGLLKVAAGQFAAAAQSFAGMETAGDSYQRALGVRLAAAAWAEQGDTARAFAALQRALGYAPTPPSASGEAQLRLGLAWLALQRGAQADARRQCTAAIAAYASPQVLVTAGTLLARLGDLDGARQALARLAPFHEQQPASEIATARLQGEIQLAMGRTAAALSLLQHAASLSNALDDREYLAHALAAAGERQQAEALYRQAAVPARVWMFAEPPLPGWYAHLAQEAARLSATPTQALVRRNPE